MKEYVLINKGIGVITKTITENIGDAYHTTEYTFNSVQELISLESSQEDGDITENSKDIKVGSICKVVGGYGNHGIKYETLVLILNNIDNVGRYVRPLDGSCLPCCVAHSDIELITNDIVGMI